ncbi:hypothetical protein SLEP1_g25964 [Rubroshorea leprosula]|uniref:DUF7722 domain-containing protein n=1 Tax=Rubroshorea leprosula TaxID=152421 RepID=A0AAV5JNK6_9ROSI|nr:hypothetical protein SLEP1_g25964 [Rubroshorea leprosula]
MALSLRWLLQSACHVLGSPNNGTIEDGGLNGTSNSKNIMHPLTVSFQMPLHYPRYTKADYEKMEEWKLDLLLTQYGLTYSGTLDEKRAFAMGAFLWPNQY